MYGCEGWDRDNPESPDSCQVSGPLPGRGYDLWRLEERCSVCGEMPRLTVKGFRGRPWKLCLNADCPSMVEMRQKREERRRARAAKETGDNGATTGDESTKADSGGNGQRTRRTRRAKPSPGTARAKRARSSARGK